MMSLIRRALHRRSSDESAEQGGTAVLEPPAELAYQSAGWSPHRAGGIDAATELARECGVADLDRMGDSIVVTLTDIRVCGDPTAATLARLLLKLHEGGANQIVFDLQNVDEIDSACLRSLVHGTNELMACGCRVALVMPAHGVGHSFRMAQIDHQFRIFNNVLNALKAVEGAAPR